MKVLLAEDDEYLLSGLIMALQHRGYTVTSARTGTEAQTALAINHFDLVLLDLGLPELDGTVVLAGLRAKGEQLPVIIITARDSVEDRVRGLDLGANDYLVKPFDFRELEARMRAVLRKSHWENRVEIEVGSLRLNTNSGSVKIRDQEIDLTPKEAVVLQTLLARFGRVVSKRDLMEQVPDWIDESSENAVEIVIHRLRRKLELSEVMINTVRGFGYVLEAKK